MICLVSFPIKLTAQSDQIFKSFRFDEDFAYLKGNDQKTSYEKIKYIPLSKEGDFYMSFGGEVRFQYFNIKNEDWGDVPDDKDGYTLNRFLAHTDLHINSIFRFFVQLQASNSNSRVDPSPVEENPLDLHQAFIDINFFNESRNKLVLRFGRYEMAYGGLRLIAVREGPNSRRSFDGVKLYFKSDNVKTDIFYTHPVLNRVGIFDNCINKDIKLWGSYTVLNDVPIISNADLYYLGIWKRNAFFDDGEGKELRHSFGARIWDSEGNWHYDFEGVYQFGNLENQHINAWTVSSNTTYQFKNVKFEPVIGLKTEVVSGNREYNDGKVETFNSLFPKGAYFGLAALIGPTNLFDIHPSIDLSLTSKLSFSIDYDLFWRLSKNDGIYAANQQLLYTGQNSDNKFIGAQYAFEAQYIVSNQLILKLEGTYFHSGSFLKDVSAGQDVAFLGVTTLFKF
ncbi:MAG: alginate export family protein [Flavobacterium sp.]|nr:alginate export family protein [Flavobacterium sp.]